MRRAGTKTGSGGITVNIMSLLLIMTVLVSVLFVVTVYAYLTNYRATLEDTAAAITRSGIDRLYDEINQMWHEISLLSGTIARSEEVQSYVKAGGRTGGELPSIRLAVNLTKIGAEMIDSVILTDFSSPPLFAYGRRDAAILEDARRVTDGGREIYSPTHFLARTPAGQVPYCINVTYTPPPPQTALCYHHLQHQPDRPCDGGR